MAQGDVVFFDQALLNIAEAKMDLELGVYFLGLIKTTVTPLVTDVNPTFGAAGTPNHKTNESTPGGNYVTNGAALLNPAVTINAGVIEIDMDDPAIWLQNVSNPTDATWGIIYNNQVAKEALGFVDLGGTFDMTTGDLDINWGAPMATLNQV